MLSALIALSVLTGPAPAPEPDPTTFYLVQGDTDERVADCLLAEGWRGQGGDHMEAIYAPRVVIQLCGGDYSWNQGA